MKDDATVASLRTLPTMFSRAYCIQTYPLQFRHVHQSCVHVGWSDTSL